MNSRRSSSISFQQPLLSRNLSFEWTPRARGLSSINSFSISDQTTPSPSDPTSIFNFEMTSANRRLTPTCEKEFSFPTSTISSSTKSLPINRTSSEWSDYYDSVEVGPLDKRSNGGNKSDDSNKSFNNNLQWRYGVGEFNVGQDQLQVEGNKNFPSAPRPSLLTTPSLSPLLPALPISPLTLPSTTSKSISPKSIQPSPTTINQPIVPSSNENNRSSHSTFQFNQPPPPLLSLPPAIQSRLNADNTRRSREVETPTAHTMITRRASIVQNESSSSKGGGAAAWLGKPAAERESSMKFSGEKRVSIKPKPVKRQKKVSVEEDEDGGEAAAALARSKSIARKLARKPVGYTPRPPNAWIIYRSEQIRLLKQDREVSKQPQSDISKLIGTMWRDESSAIKKKYEILAEAAKAEHTEKYPGYRFKPVRRGDKVPASPVQYQQKRQPSIYPPTTASPHKTRSSTSGPSGVSYAALQFLSSSNQSSSSRPQTPASPGYNSGSDYEPPTTGPSNITYHQYVSPKYQNQPQYQQPTPAFYYDNGLLPTPPNSAASFAYPSRGNLPQLPPVDPNVAAFFASLANDQSPVNTNFIYPQQQQTDPRSTFDPNNAPVQHPENPQEVAAAWNEFEQTTPRWFPPTPPEALQPQLSPHNQQQIPQLPPLHLQQQQLHHHLQQPPQSAPATITQFNPNYSPQASNFAPYYPLVHRSSTGSTRNYQKLSEVNWTPQVVPNEEYITYPPGTQYSDSPMSLDREE